MINELTRSFTVDGVALAWDRWGVNDTGAPLFLCHGFSGSSHDFALQIETLGERREVVSIDHRGHGRSEKLRALAGYSVERLANDLISLLDTEIGRPVDLLGHSMGGAISLRVALARPDLVRSLILMDTSAWSFTPPDEQIARFLATFMETFDPATGLPDTTALAGPEVDLIASSTPADWQATKEQMAAAFDPYAMKALGRDLFDAGRISVRDRLAEIACPVTVVVGEHDHPFVDQAAELAAEVPDGQLTVIPGAYHSPQLTHSTEWLAAVEGHLARVTV